jgi:hypothetical protein
VLGRSRSAQERRRSFQPRTLSGLRLTGSEQNVRWAHRQNANVPGKVREGQTVRLDAKDGTLEFQKKWLCKSWDSGIDSIF